jgi:hypothetical protein
MKYRSKEVIEAIQWLKLEDHPRVRALKPEDAKEFTGFKDIPPDWGVLEIGSGRDMVSLLIRPGDYVLEEGKGWEYREVFENRYEPIL